jgi:hypothetical protein
LRSARHEDGFQLIACSHGNDVQWRAVQDDIGTFARSIDFDTKAVEFFEKAAGAVSEIRHEGIVLKG